MNEKNCLIGRVTAEHKERYEVMAEDRLYLANVKGMDSMRIIQILKKKPTTIR